MQHIVVVSHRRSGTHLTIDSILNNLAPFGRAGAREPFNLDLLLPRHAREPMSNEQLTEMLRPALDGPPRVFKTHAHADLDRFFGAAGPVRDAVRLLQAECPWINVVRDGRDVMVSLYHYQKEVDPARRAMSFSEFLRSKNPFDAETLAEPMSRPEYWRHHVEGWTEHGCAAVQFESFISDYPAAVADLADRIGVDVKRRHRDVRQHAGGALQKNWLRLRQRLLPAFLRRTRTTAVAFRGGRSGDWRTLFEPEDLAYFEEQAGEINASLGYVPRVAEG